LNWTLLHNYGAAFSFLSDAGGWQRYFFTSLAGIVSVIFVFWLMRMPKNMKVLPLAIALILGGAIGNLIDRVSLGYVVDFIHVYLSFSVVMKNSVDIVKTVSGEAQVSLAIGDGNLLPGFDTVLFGFRACDRLTVSLLPVESFGPWNPENIQKFDTVKFGGRAI